MMENVLEVNNVSFSYKDDNIFNNVTFNVEKNTIVSILGSNNCGKTTLIKMISGIFPISSGEIIVDNTVMNRKNAKKCLLNIGIVLNDVDKQFLFDDVRSELAFPLANLRFKPKQIDERINEIADLLSLSDLIEKNINELNILEKVLVLIAVAIIHKPKILFIDNIISNLTLADKEIVFGYFLKIIKDWNMSVVFTTSDLNEAIIADKIAVIGNGSIAFCDSVDAVLDKDNELAKLGIDIPTMIDLSLKLKFYNLVDRIYLDPDEVVNKLWP